MTVSDTPPDYAEKSVSHYIMRRRETPCFARGRDICMYKQVTNTTHSTFCLLPFL